MGLPAGRHARAPRITLIREISGAARPISEIQNKLSISDGLFIVILAKYSEVSCIST